MAKEIKNNLATNPVSTKSLLIGGGAAWLGYQALSRKASDDHIARMKGEREVSLLGSAAGLGVAGATFYATRKEPFSKLIEQSRIRSEKIYKSHDAKGFLNSFKTPNK